MRPDKTIFVLREALHTKLEDILLLRKGKWPDRKPWGISNKGVILGVPFGISEQGGLDLLLEDLNLVLRDRIIRPLGVLERMAKSWPPGDALFMLKRFLIPKLDQLAGIYGLNPRAERCWVEVDGALNNLLKVAMPNHCSNTNRTLRSELSLPPRDGGWGVKRYQQYAPAIASRLWTKGDEVLACFEEAGLVMWACLTGRRQGPFPNPGRVALQARASTSTPTALGGSCGLQVSGGRTTRGSPDRGPMPVPIALRIAKQITPIGSRRLDRLSPQRDSSHLATARSIVALG